MPLSLDIRLPKSITPIFPDRCVYSGEAAPDGEVRVFANSQNPFLSALSPLFLLFGWQTVRVPIHKRHRWKFYFQNYGRDILMIILAVVLVFQIMPHLDRKAAFAKFKLMGLVLLALSPWILFEVFVPRRFNITARGDWIEYEFADHDMGQEFAILNGGTVLKVN